jgi:hypothetical protein
MRPRHALIRSAVGFRHRTTTAIVQFGVLRQDVPRRSLKLVVSGELLTLMRINSSATRDAVRHATSSETWISRLFTSGMYPRFKLRDE